MTSSTKVQTWLKTSPLAIYDVAGQILFPLYGFFGGIMATYVFYVARRMEDFPENGDMGLKALSDNDKYACVHLSGAREYKHEDIIEILERIEKILL